MKWSKIVQHFRSFLWSMVVFGKGKVIVGRILSGLGKAFSAFKKIIRRKIFLGMKSNDYMYIECHLYLGIQQKSTPELQPALPKGTAQVGPMPRTYLSSSRARQL